MKSSFYTVLVACLLLAFNMIGQEPKDNVTFGEDMNFMSSKSDESSNYLCNATIKKYSPTESLRHSLTGVDIEIFNKTTQKLVLNLKNHQQNRFSYNFLHGNEYVIMLRRKGYMIKRINAKIGVDGCIACFDGLYTLTPANASEVKSIVNLNVMMRPINEGDRVILPEIQFENKSSEITSATAKALDELAMVIKDNDNILAQLEVHTDARGNADANLKLSQDRADAITKYLVSKGISAKDFYVKGYGERKIVNNCYDGVDCAETQHNQNKRVIYWLRAQIGENELFEQPLTSILKNEGNTTFAAPLEEAGDGKMASVGKRGDEPKQEEVVAKPTIQMDMADNNKVDDAEISKFAEESAGKDLTSADVVFPRQRSKNEDDKFGSSAFVNQVDVKPEEVKDICDVNGIKPNSQLTKKEVSEDKGITVSRLPKDAVPGSEIMSKTTEVTYDDGDAIVRRSGRAILVDKLYNGYKVELFTSEQELDNNHAIFKRYGKIFLDDTGTAFSYMIGSFEQKDAAEKFLDTVIKPFYPEAKVIRYKSGKRK